MGFSSFRVSDFTVSMAPGGEFRNAAIGLDFAGKETYL
jgi:hypothetical protein